MKSMMQLALGSDFQKLPKIIQKHYFFENEQTTLLIYGEMEYVKHSIFAKPFVFVGSFIKALVPYQGENIPTKLYSTHKGNYMNWKRELYFPGKTPFIFFSKMISPKQGQIIEYIALGLGVVMNVSLENEVLWYRVSHYVWNLGFIKIPIPSFLMLGGGYIKNEAINDEKFKMKFELKHPLFGFVFGYAGEFQVKVLD